MSVGVMEDYKLRDLHASHTLGWLGDIFFKFVYYKWRKLQKSHGDKGSTKKVQTWTWT